jgi:hypothetical protein
MKIMYCWRCDMDVPMLDEGEFAAMSELYSECMRAAKEFRQEHGLPLQGLGVDERFQPMRAAHERLTGYKGFRETAIMHHRISLYGPPCARCGRPLRTPDASKCMACGADREDGG